MRALQDWPTAIPRIHAVPSNGFEIPHLTVTPEEMASALDTMKNLAPEGPSWWVSGVAAFRAEIDAGRMGAAMMVLWNLAAGWGFRHGSFAGKNGEALGSHEARAPQRLGGGKKPGSGRKREVASDEVLCAAFDEVTQKHPRMKVVERRKEAVRLLKGRELHANGSAIAGAMADRKRRVGNR